MSWCRGSPSNRRFNLETQENMTGPTNASADLLLELRFGEAWRDRFKLSSSFAEELTNQITTQLRLLLVEARFPESWSIQTSLAGLAPTDQPEVVSVTVNGERCRPNLQVQPDPESDCFEVAGLVIDTVVQNRDLLISEALVREVRRRGKFAFEMASGALRKPLAELISRGISLNYVDTLNLAELDQDRLETNLARALPLRIAVELGREQYQAMFLSDRQGRIVLERAANDLRNKLFSALGIRLPTIEFRFNPDLPDDAFCSVLNCLRTPFRRGLRLGESLIKMPFRDPHTVLRPEVSRPAPSPFFGQARVIHSTVIQEKLQADGCEMWDPQQYILLVQEELLRRNARLFLTTSQVEFDLGLLFNTFPTLVRIASERFSIPRLTRILRGLLEEQISVVDLRTILEELVALETRVETDLTEQSAFYRSDGVLIASGNRTEMQAESDCVEYLRVSLSSLVSLAYSSGRLTIPVYRLSAEIEKRLLDTDRYPLSAEERIAFLEAVLKAHRSRRLAHGNPVILTAFALRRKVRDLLMREFPQLPVMSYQELASGYDFQPLAEISWAKKPVPIA
jgi:FHIPEP family